MSVDTNPGIFYQSVETINTELCYFCGNFNKSLEDDVTSSFIVQLVSK